MELIIFFFIYLYFSFFHYHVKSSESGDELVHLFITLKHTFRDSEAGELVCVCVYYQQSYKITKENGGTMNDINTPNPDKKNNGNKKKKRKIYLICKKTKQKKHTN